MNTLEKQEVAKKIIENMEILKNYLSWKSVSIYISQERKEFWEDILGQWKGKTLEEFKKIFLKFLDQKINEQDLKVFIKKYPKIYIKFLNLEKELYQNLLINEVKNNIENHYFLTKTEVLDTLRRFYTNWTWNYIYNLFWKKFEHMVKIGDKFLLNSEFFKNWKILTLN